MSKQDQYFGVDIFSSALLELKFLNYHLSVNKYTVVYSQKILAFPCICDSLGVHLQCKRDFNESTKNQLGKELSHWKYFYIYFVFSAINLRDQFYFVVTDLTGRHVCCRAAHNTENVSSSQHQHAQYICKKLYHLHNFVPSLYHLFMLYMTIYLDQMEPYSAQWLPPMAMQVADVSK